MVELAHVVTCMYAAPANIARDALCACQELLVYTRRTEQVESVWLTQNTYIVSYVCIAHGAALARDALCACQELLVYTRRTEQVEALWLTETAQICTYAWMPRAS